MQLADFWGEAFPNWIVAGTSVFTTAAAIFAGYYARQAAHWTRKQSEAADGQVKLAEAALDSARQDSAAARLVATVQRREAAKDRRSIEEQRLDERIPAVLARARPQVPSIEKRFQMAGGVDSGWQEVTDPGFVSIDDEITLFRVTVLIFLENVSTQIAEISVNEVTPGELTSELDRTFVLAPSERRTVRWHTLFSRYVFREEQTFAEHAVFRLKFWVRDLGQNVRDEYAFSAALDFFERDGSRVNYWRAPAKRWGMSSQLQYVVYMNVWTRGPWIPLRNLTSGPHTGHPQTRSTPRYVRGSPRSDRGSERGHGPRQRR